MTVKELYEMTVKYGIENYELRVHYSDDGGFYVGSRPVLSCNIDVDHIDKTIDF